jgi:MOSC domain-containing protein YiiM
MKTFEELEAGWQALGRGGPQGVVKQIVVRVREGVHETPRFARLDPDEGVEGDRWAHGPRDVRAQVTLMDAAVAALVGAPELAGDNFLVDLDLGERALPVGARVRLGAAVVEVTDKPHTGCKKFAERFGQDALRWVNWHAHRERRLRGVHCRVVEGATVAIGDLVSALPLAVR